LQAFVDGAKKGTASGQDAVPFRSEFQGN